mmetsp:Transcript_52247/g.168245  ORF Transcript_52247/g.168245 Transcript_52247/m.168245 type:complete len:144 (+) Transcript_52247:109-540(+)
MWFALPANMRLASSVLLITQVMTLSAEAFSIGRLACCDVHIQKQTEDSSVSRIQCWVFSLPIGLIVVDGWSVAGTSLLDDDDRTNTLPASSPNGRRNFIIPHGKPATLRLATFGTEVGPAFGFRETAASCCCGRGCGSHFRQT